MTAGREIDEGLARVRRRRALLIAVGASLPIALGVFFLAPWPRGVREGIVLAWIAAYSLATMLHVFSRCPRCGHLFHSVRGFHNPFAPRCRGCGLSIHDD